MSRALIPVSHRVQAFAAGAKSQAKGESTPLATSISNYSQTDAISRASSTMAKCVLARSAQAAKQSAATQ